MNVLQEALLVTDKKVDDALPCIREIVALSFIDNLRGFNLDFIALEARNLDVLLVVESHFNNLPGLAILLLHV